MTQEEIIAEDDRLITVDVARAVDERELIAYYQPVVNIGDGGVESAEALVRWTMPDGTVVPAALFVPSLERTNTISGLDWYMIEEICSFLESATDTAAHVPVALNLSPRHAGDPDFVSKLAASTGWHNVAHDLIRLEFRRTDVLASDELKALVTAALKDGFGVTIDNFAGDEEDLRTLSELGVGSVKLARMIWHDAADESITSFIETAAKLGITLCAETVEDEDDLARLKKLSIGRAQGYHFAKPADRTAFEAYCAR